MLNAIAIDDSVSTETRDFLQSFYTIADNADWLLTQAQEVLAITDKRKRLSLCIDFRSGHYRHRNQHKAKEPLVQAVKIKKKLPQTLIDATPGVLKDAFMLASRGITVCAIERNPLLYVMVKQALSVVEKPPRIDYHFGDARELLPQFSAEIIYLDPMYPLKKGNAKKGAQVKKDMQLLHDIVGKDDDADLLFQVARQQPSRVVVKRPSYATPISDEKPSFVSQTGSTRFDIYLPIT